METIAQMFYGDPETYRAAKAVKAGQLVQLGTRGAVACSDIPKGESGSVYVRGDFFFDCAADYEVEESAPIAYDFERKAFARVGSPGSIIVGSAIFSTPKGSKFIGLQLNG